MTESHPPQAGGTGTAWTEPPTKRRVFFAVVALAAAYFYFLIFAEFALIELLRERGQDGHLNAVLALLGISGIGGSLAAAWRFHADTGRWNLAAGFLGCAAAGFHSSATSSWPLPLVSAVLVGGSTGWTTVTLALCLRPTVRHRRLGLWTGLGTGIAYALCNQPWVFSASTERKVTFATLAAGIGFLAALGIRSAPRKISTSADYSRAAQGGWIVALLALVWLDSSVFYIIQHSPSLRIALWEGEGVLQGNAFIHLATAVLAGLTLDQHRSGLVAAVALGLLVLASTLLNTAPSWWTFAGTLYTTGVSLYSTTLVFLPARGGRPRQAAALFAVAGWGGSALAIATAKSFMTVPLWLILAAAVVGAAGLGFRHWAIRANQERAAPRS
jgi:hypothetical protein